MVQNLSWRIFLQEEVKFLKSGNWFQFYNASNKDTFFDLPGMFSKLIIKLNKLGSTYESNMDNVMLIPLLVMIGSTWQQHYI